MYVALLFFGKLRLIVSRFETMERFRNKYRIQTSRLQGYDYGSNGLYFVTINTQDRKYTLGRIVNNSRGCKVLQPSEIGKIAIAFWHEIPVHYPFVELDAFVCMPNHIHGIICINKPIQSSWEPNRFGVQSQNLGAIIRGYKSSVKRLANQNEIDFAWQPRFHDRIIRDSGELNRIRKYIHLNPRNWKDIDEQNPLGSP